MSSTYISQIQYDSLSAAIAADLRSAAHRVLATQTDTRLVNAGLLHKLSGAPIDADDPVPFEQLAVAQLSACDVWPEACLADRRAGGDMSAHEAMTHAAA